MKKIFTTFSCILMVGLAFAQPINTGLDFSGKIKLANGQKIIVETTTDVDASLAMGMQLTGNTVSVNSLDVKSSREKDFTVASTLTKLKVNTNMMGQPNNYDSENKESNSAEMAGVFDNSLNNPVEIIIDNRTGMQISDKKKTKSKDSDGSSSPSDMMKIFSDNSDDFIVSGAFEIIPAGKTIGSSWSDTSKTKAIKIIRTYTLNAVSGNEATIQVDIVSNAVNKMDYMGMEFEIKTQTKTKGEIITDITTGLVKKRTTKSDITGSLPMMGQEMPISAKTNSTSIYK